MNPPRTRPPVQVSAGGADATSQVGARLLADRTTSTGRLSELFVVVDRFGWRFLWGLGVVLNVLGTVWIILYLLVRYFVSGLF